MRTSMKVSMGVGAATLFLHFFRFLAFPSQEEIRSMDASRLQAADAFFAFLNLLIALGWLIAIFAFVYAVYKNIVEVRQTVVTNHIGDKNEAREGSVIVTRGASVRDISTGDNISGNTFQSMTLDEALHEVLGVIKASEKLNDDDKAQASGLVKKVKEAKQTGYAPLALIKNFLELADKAGPAAKGVSEAIDVIKKIMD